MHYQTENGDEKMALINPGQGEILLIFPQEDQKRFLVSIHETDCLEQSIPSRCKPQKHLRDRPLNEPTCAS